ncbi:MAG: calcium/sodium antiporter [Bacteroidetes bacterium]|nr:calcium/sodium antiporter [Bacteroidota bacterium]
MTWLWLIGGLVVLVVGGELLVQNASALALKAKVSPLIVGLTVVAMGTSAPELFASLQAAWKGDGSIAIGNVLGSNVANLGLALGLTALVSPVAMKWCDLKMHWWVMLAATVAFMVFVQDLTLTRQEGLMLLAGGALYLGGQILAARRDANSSVAEELLEEAGDASRPYPVLLGLLVMGCVGLFFGSEAFVFGASEIALDWGVSTHVIGVTVVAFGTSVPEIAASLTAAIKGNSALSIGNLVGSNILNILLVLGATAEVGTLKVSEVVPVHDVWWMLGAAVLLAPLMVLGKGNIGRVSGALYVGIYVAYVVLVVTHG